MLEDVGVLRTVYREAQGRGTNILLGGPILVLNASGKLKVGSQEVPLRDTENTSHRKGSA